MDIVVCIACSMSCHDKDVSVTGNSAARLNTTAWAAATGWCQRLSSRERTPSAGWTD